jgi:uncharacterized protein
MYRISSMRQLCIGAALVLGLFAMLPAAAQDPGPFEGEVPVASQDIAERNAALPRAMADLLVKLTGDPEAATDPAFAEALQRAPALMQQFRYRQSAGRLSLIASFERRAVLDSIERAGRRLWAEPRPQPVVWLAIDDGRGPRLVGTAQAQAVAALRDRAVARGLKLSFPLLDLEDQRLIDAGRVWNSDIAAVAAATRRYAANSALFGRLSRGGEGWVADWSVLDGDRVIGQQRSTDAEAAAVLAAGADFAVTTLARHHAEQQMDAGPAGAHAIWVEGIADAADYARAVGYLQRLPSVRGVQPVRSSGERVLLLLDLGSGIEGFGRRLANEGVLEPLPAAPGGGERRFLLQP